MSAARPLAEPAHNVEAAEAVLGAMLLSPEALVAAFTVLQVEDLYGPAHCRSPPPASIRSASPCCWPAGCIYTVGAIMLVRRWPDPNPAVFGYHEVWHVLTVVAGACQGTVIWLLVRWT